MITPTINRLQSRMEREMSNCVAMLNMGDLVYIALKKEQITQRYLKLMQAATRRKWE